MPVNGRRIAGPVTHAYGTIMVDLEGREVIDVLRERAAAATARWLAERPGVEIVARDRCDLYAEGARLGAQKSCRGSPVTIPASMRRCVMRFAARERLR